MNIIDRIMENQAKRETSLGNPLVDPDAIERRLTHFAQMTGGKGFRTPEKSQRVDAQGRTRGDRKRLARELAAAKASAQIAENISKQNDWI